MKGKAMKGNNEIKFNSLTMKAAVQHYFDTVLFAKGESPSVTRIDPDSRETEKFIIKIQTPPSGENTP